MGWSWVNQVGDSPCPEQGQKPKHQTVGLPFKRAEIRAILYTGNTMDDDKFMARLKGPLGKKALVRAGILADDKRPSCRVLEPQQTIDRRHPRVEITVTEVV